jgi:hypothetical protein
MAKTRNRFIRLVPFLQCHWPQAKVGADGIEEEQLKYAGARAMIEVVKDPAVQVFLN